MDYIYTPWNFPGYSTGVGSLSLLQGILPAQGSNPGLPHCGQILYQLRHKGKNTGMGSLSLLQQVFLTLESNQDLLHPELLQARSSTDCVELNTTPSKRQDWK